MAAPLSSNLSWDLAKTQWAQAINPVLAAPVNNIQIIKNVALANGTTVINHSLGHMMTGWILVDIQGAATIYRSAPFNSLTLTLTSNAVVTVSIGVF